MLVIFVWNYSGLIYSLAIFKHALYFDCLLRRLFLILYLYFVTLAFYTSVKTRRIMILFTIRRCQVLMVRLLRSYCNRIWWLQIQSISFNRRLVILIIWCCIGSLITIDNCLTSPFTKIILHPNIVQIFIDTG